MFLSKRPSEDKWDIMTRLISDHLTAGKKEAGGPGGRVTETPVHLKCIKFRASRTSSTRVPRVTNTELGATCWPVRVSWQSWSQARLPPPQVTLHSPAGAACQL